MAKEIEFKDRVSPENAAVYKCELKGGYTGESKLMATSSLLQTSLMVSSLSFRFLPPLLNNVYCRPLVDGNGWSSRFSRLLMSGSVVIKHTLFPEWHHVSTFFAI